MSLTVHLGSITMNNGVADSDGSLWYVEGMDGWDSPAVRNTVLYYPTEHGGTTTSGLYGVRSIVLTGLCKATSEANFYASMYRLTGVTNVLNRYASSSLVFSVEEDAHRFCNVYRSGEIKTTYIGGNSFRFQVPLRADDPIKYGVTAVSGTLAASTPTVLANAGNIATFPHSFELNATGTPTITVGSLSWNATASIPSGTVINFKAKTVKNGSTSHIDKVNLGSDWLYLSAGNNTVESSISVDYAYYPAWI